MLVGDISIHALCVQDYTDRTSSAEQILEAISRYYQRISQTGHHVARDGRW